MHRRFCWLSILVFMLCPVTWAQGERLDDSEKPRVVVEDLQGKRVEGYLSVYPKEITVTSKEKEEKTISL